MIYFLPLLPLFFGVISSCQYSSTPIARVGSYTITEQDLGFQEKILRMSYPEYPGDTKQAALQQLTEAFSYAEILYNNAHPITPEILKEEAIRIDKTTLLPNKLAAIKVIFEGNEKSYHKVYILPIYVSRVIYFDFFLQDKKIQAESLVEAESFLQKVLRSPSLFYSRNIKNIHFTVSLQRGIEFKNQILEKNRSQNTPPVEVEKKIKHDQHKQESETGKRWVQGIISKLKPGGIHPQVIDQQTDWWVVRFLQKKHLYEMEAAVFPKADYGKWLETEKKKIH